jgi:D-alanine transaminase
MTSKIVYLNNQFINYEDAYVHIEDRGFQLADGIYEVILFENNKLIDFDNHINRLFRSAQEIDLKIEQTSAYFKEIILKLFKENNLNSGSVYLQITRGKNPRSQTLPKTYNSTVNAIVNPLKVIDEKSLSIGFKAITHEDIRWKRCDIKSIALLASTMLKQKAEDKGAIEAILIKDGIVTEGSFCNVFIVNNKQQIITRESGNHILKGITRDRIIQLAKQEGLEIIEGKFSEAELLSAKEVFLTSSTLKVRPINKINDTIVGNEKAGEITKKLIKLYANFIL